MRKFSLVLSLILLITMVASVPAVAEEKITLTVLDCSDTCYTYRQEATESGWKASQCGGGIHPYHLGQPGRNHHGWH